MTSPSVSVVIIVKDGERFLPEAIESVHAQTMPATELIIVDDGSTDRTSTIIDRAIEAARGGQTQIRVRRHPGGRNRGMSRSRNLGLAHARGEFTTFLDHDDAMLPDKLAVMTDAIRRHPDAVAVIGPNRRWRSWSGGRDDDQRLGSETETILAPPGLLPHFLSDSGAVPLAPLLRTVPVRRLGGYVEGFRGMHEDQAFLARLMLRAPVTVVEDVLHLYRQHDESCVARTHHEGRDLLARRHFLVWLERELRHASTPDVPLQQMLQRELAKTRGWRRRWFRRRLINLRRRGSVA